MSGFPDKVIKIHREAPWTVARTLPGLRFRWRRGLGTRSLSRWLSSTRDVAGIPSRNVQRAAFSAEFHGTESRREYARLRALHRDAVPAAVLHVGRAARQFPANSNGRRSVANSRCTDASFPRRSNRHSPVALTRRARNSRLACPSLNYARPLHLRCLTNGRRCAARRIEPGKLINSGVSSMSKRRRRDNVNERDSIDE